LAANIFLHYVLDDWYEQEVKPRLKGRSFLQRFADDFIIGCELESDARRVMEVLPKRFERYGLTVHPEKTKLVKFGKPPKKEQSGPKNETFDFLGFTHYWAKSRRGYWVIKRKTARKRQRRSIKALWQWCKEKPHLFYRRFLSPIEVRRGASLERPGAAECSQSRQFLGRSRPVRWSARAPQAV
jgi:hypothetical protein